MTEMIGGSEALAALSLAAEVGLVGLTVGVKAARANGKYIPIKVLSCSVLYAVLFIAAGWLGAKLLEPKIACAWLPAGLLILVFTSGVALQSVLREKRRGERLSFFFVISMGLAACIGVFLSWRAEYSIQWLVYSSPIPLAGGTIGYLCGRRLSRMPVVFSLVAFILTATTFSACLI